MFGNSFGHNFRITTWGESHGIGIGVVIDGFPSNFPLNDKDIQKELDRRKPGQSNITTERVEADKVEILSGVFNGKTLGTPIALMIYNQDQKSADYENIKDIYRPGHADYTYQVKYGIRDYRGGGRQSARETIARVAAGAIAKKYLAEKCNLKIFGFTKKIGKFTAKNIDLKEIEKNNVRCPDKEVAKKMERLILKLKETGDSIGGIVEIIIKNCPAGLGEPVFNKIKADLASALVGINGVQSFEYGDFSDLSTSQGTTFNDEFFQDKNGKIHTKTNHHGGILGGITTGEDIVLRIGVKPTSSILSEQKTIDLSGKTKKIKIKGRHDPCLAPRLIPIAEAMVTIVLLDHYLQKK